MYGCPKLQPSLKLPMFMVGAFVHENPIEVVIATHVDTRFKRKDRKMINDKHFHPENTKYFKFTCTGTDRRK